MWRCCTCGLPSLGTGIDHLLTREDKLGKKKATLANVKLPQPVLTRGCCTCEGVAHVEVWHMLSVAHVEVWHGTC